VRIAHLVSSLLAPLGGAEQYCIEVAAAQAAAGDDVTILTGWTTDDVVAELAGRGVEVRRIPVRRPHRPDRRGSRPAALLFHALDLLDTLRTPARMRRILAEQWDVVHAHRVVGLGAGVLRTAPAPVVMTVHDYSLVDTASNLLRRGAVRPGPPLLQRLRTRAMARALVRTTVVFPSELLRERHRAWGLDPARSVILPHGWRIGARPRHAPADGPVVFLFLGKLIPTKGVAELLDAWGDGIPGAELWIAGAGPLEDRVAAAPVRFLGWLDAAGRDAALGAASALVLPSTGPEIFLLAAAEGALAGLPVVSTTVAAPPAVRNEVSGVFAEPEPAALRAAMIRLLDPAERERLAAGARAFAADLDLDRHLDRLSVVYSEAGARQPEAAR
jgi:glycosyltransferase involved in cell wall biosynthesis